MKKEEEIIRKHQKKNYAKAKQVIVSQLKSKDKEDKKMINLALTQQNLLYEDEERLKIEADIAQLENEEYELIQKLQNTELLQASGCLLVNIVAERNLQVVTSPTTIVCSPSNTTYRNRFRKYSPFK